MFSAHPRPFLISRFENLPQVDELNGVKAIEKKLADLRLREKMLRQKYGSTRFGIFYYNEKLIS